MEHLGDQNNHIVLEDDNGVLPQEGLAAVDDAIHAAPQANGPMHWTPVQSAFMLRRFHDLI